MSPANKTYLWLASLAQCVNDCLDVSGCEVLIVVVREALNTLGVVCWWWCVVCELGVKLEGKARGEGGGERGTCGVLTNEAVVDRVCQPQLHCSLLRPSAQHKQRKHSRKSQNTHTPSLTHLLSHQPPTSFRPTTHLQLQSWVR